MRRRRQAAAAAYENGWNAINQFIREDCSWNGREPNVFYVRHDGRYVDYLRRERASISPKTAAPSR